MMQRPNSSNRMLPVTTTSTEARRHFLAGRHHAFHYQDRQARDELDAALAADPQFVLAYLHRGGMSPPDERGPYFEQARTHRDRVSEDEGLMVDAFHAFLWEPRVEDAISIFTELTDRYPDDPYLPTYLGLRYLHNLDRLDAAKEQFERARDRDPDFAQARFWLGQVALREGDHARAEEEFRAYAEMAPDQPRPYNCLGDLARRRGLLDEAEQWFHNALEQDPGFVEGQENLAWVQIERSQRRLDDALRDRDFEAVAKLYTARAEVTARGQRLTSSDAIAEFWEQTLDSSTTVEVTSQEVYLGLDSDLATQVASYRFVSADTTEDAGRAITVWGKSVTGWRIYRSVWASEAAPAP